LRGPIDPAEAGIIVPILVGPVTKIKATARQHGIDVSRFELVDAPPQRCRRSQSRRGDPPIPWRAADEGQPPHRRAHARGHIEQDVQNAIDMFTQVGLGTPRVAILSAVETVTNKIPSTIEAAALCKMAERGQITGGILDVPLAFDNAIDPEAAQIKAIKSEVAGSSQIPVVPSLE